MMLHIYIYKSQLNVDNNCVKHHHATYCTCCGCDCTEKLREKPGELKIDSEEALKVTFTY